MHEHATTTHQPQRGGGDGTGLRLGYIVGLHPALSMTFVLHEVEALRARGLSIETISIRRATGEHLLSERHRAAAASTYSILPPRWPDLAGAHLRALVRRPLRYLATLALALRLAPPGLRGTIWQLFYFGEALVAWHVCARAGVRHLHAHMANVPADVALLAAHYGRWSWSFTMHGSFELFGVKQHRLPEKVRSAEFVACISDFTRSQLMNHVDEDQWDKLHVVRCGLDPDEFRRRTPYGDGETILAVGRLVPEKGYTVLLQALRQLRDGGVAARLVVVGSGPKDADLRATSSALGLDDAVTFAGAVGQDDIRDLYEEAALFCSPSLAEGIPFVLMEAMALELPVVASRIMGVPELVEDGVAGLLVPPGNPEALAGALAELLGDPSRRVEMGRAGRARIERSFDVARSAERLSQLFAAAQGKLSP